MTPLAATDRLPLTCTREGGCCHGHIILLNPWELARLARAVKLSPRVFRDQRMQGGVQLAFDGPANAFGRTSCGLYRDGGCSVHPDRPLACRLFPLGRRKIAGAVQYYHTGDRLPCLAVCPSVGAQPPITVADYCASQDLAQGEATSDAYADLAYGMVVSARQLMQQALSGTEAKQVRDRFAATAALEPARRAARLPQTWFDRLTVPDIPPAAVNDPAGFVRQHGLLLATAVQKDFATPKASMADAATIYLGMALVLGATVGFTPADIEGALA